MNINIQIFEEYIGYRPIELWNDLNQPASSERNIIFCGMECEGCGVRSACFEKLGLISPKLTSQEVEILKEKYPEVFI